MVGQILVIVVAIVATIYTAGLAAQGFAAAQGVALGGTASSSAFAHWAH